MTRSEHLEWAKKRALDLLDEHGPTAGPFMAWTAFKHDLGKHEELKSHIAIEMGDMIFNPIFHRALFGNEPDALLTLSAPGLSNLREFIEGFN